jgi:transcriptional regulator with XRE-family HTH domain
LSDRALVAILQVHVRTTRSVFTRVNVRHEGRGRMTLQTPRSFNSWLRGQLKEKKMSQRQLALQSGVDHSTISRLIKGDRMPSLGTATKLARGLREIRDEAEGPSYFASLAARQLLPTARVEYALRGDDALTENDVRELMQQYIATRARRTRENEGPGAGPSGLGSSGRGHDRPVEVSAKA